MERTSSQKRWYQLHESPEWVSEHQGKWAVILRGGDPKFFATRMAANTELMRIQNRDEDVVVREVGILEKPPVLICSPTQSRGEADGYRATLPVSNDSGQTIDVDFMIDTGAVRGACFYLHHQRAPHTPRLNSSTPRGGALQMQAPKGASFNIEIPLQQDFDGNGHWSVSHGPARAASTAFSPGASSAKSSERLKRTSSTEADKNAG